MPSIRKSLAKLKPSGPKQGRWTDVRYMLFVTIKTIPRAEATGVFGRCLGLRSDGQAFNSVVGIPWIVTKKFDWKVIGKSRLDTYLLRECKCRTIAVQTITCPMHKRLEAKWQAENLRAVGIIPQDVPVADAPMGATSDVQVMNRGYPWCLKDIRKNEWVCDICKAHQNAYDDNPSWRNQFIHQHAKCGFPSAGYAARAKTLTIRTTMDAAHEADKRIDALQKQIDALSRIRMAVGGARLGPYDSPFDAPASLLYTQNLPEVMSFEEFVRYAIDKKMIGENPEIKMLAEGDKP